MWHFLIILTVLFPFLYKYSFVVTNQFSQIPIILSFTDPNYLKNDWYVQVSQDFGPRTIFAFYMAQLAKVLSLPTVFFIHYLLYIFLIVVATYKLSFLIFRKKYIAQVTTICIIFGTSITLGGNMLVTPDFVAPQLPLGLSLLAIALIFKKRYFASSLLFSLSSYLHPLIGFESAIIFFSTTFLTFIFLKKSLKKIISHGFVPFFLFSLPALLLYLSQGLKGQIPISDKITLLAFVRNPHHFIPSSFPLWHYVRFLILLVLFLLIVFKLIREIKKHLIGFTFISFAMIIILCLVGFLATEVIPFYPGVLMQPFRLTLYIYWIAASVVFGGILHLVFKEKKYSILLFIPIFLTNPEYFSLFGKIKILATFLGIIIIFFYKRLPKQLFISLLVVFFSLQRFHQNFNFSSLSNYQTEENKIAQWVRENTAESTIFLIPPEFESFRLVANRAIVADWKSFPFQDKAMKQWAERLCDISNIKPCNHKDITENKVISGYRDLDINTILYLSKKYGFTNMITRIYYKELKTVYHESLYVYEIDNEKIMK